MFKNKKWLAAAYRTTFELHVRVGWLAGWLNHTIQPYYFGCSFKTENAFDAGPLNKVYDFMLVSVFVFFIF